MDLTIRLRLPVRVTKKGKWFVSSRPTLDVFSQGRSKAEAERNLVDAVCSTTGYRLFALALALL
jgi:hypothetical protein